MKIALTLPALPFSGIGTSVSIIESGLKNAGHKIDVIITGLDAGDDIKFAEQAGWNLKFPGRAVRFLPHRLKKIADFLNNNGYEIILNNTSQETQLILPYLRRDLLRVAILRSLNPAALGHIATNSDYLHAAIGISAEMVRIMEEDARIKTTVELIPNCTRVIGEKFPLLEEHIKICSIGRLSNSDKNVAIIPLIMALLRKSGMKASLDVAGDGPARKDLEKQIRRLNLDNVKLHGSVPRSQANQLMSKAHFVLLPSVTEGLSNVMLEGMAFGCLPVCSDIENFKWVLGEASEQLQCRLYNAEDYSQRIIYFTNHTDVYRKTQQYLRKRQQLFFTPEQTILKYSRLLDELRSGGGSDISTPLDLKSLCVPREYSLYCSPAWLILQKMKDTFCRKKTSE